MRHNDMYDNDSNRLSVAVAKIMCATIYRLQTIAIASIMPQRHLHIILRGFQLSKFYPSTTQDRCRQVNYLCYSSSRYRDVRLRNEQERKHKRYSLRWSHSSEIENLRFEFNVVSSFQSVFPHTNTHNCVRSVNQFY